MSTAALSAPQLEVTAPDTMDVHSDNGLDFGDGDIDIDLRSTGAMDDDVSLRDAATDNGLEEQAMSGDQDDFMVDEEDLIEEDAVEDVEADIELQPAELTTIHVQTEPTAPEEDLIDYSDDEDATLDEPPVAADVHDNDNVDSTDAAPKSEEALVTNDPADSGGNEEEATASSYATYPHQDQGEEGDRDGSTVVENQSLPATHQSGEQTASPPLDEVQHEVKPDVQPSNEADPTTLERSASDVQVNPSAAADAESLSTGQNGQVSQDVSLHPITVNYDGAELWLFKCHDYEDSGDYLLDDDSFLSKPVSALLDACREALGADVSNDLELGIRLDSLYNIDLYSEHSSCLFVKLSDLVHVYLQLHAQDGVTEPESFYITIVSRPRVSSLFTELVKAAEHGMGRSGLDDAIAAGQTCFNAHFTHNSTEQVYGDWDEEEQEEPATEDNSEHGEQDGYEEDYHENNEDNEGVYNDVLHENDKEKENGEEQNEEQNEEENEEGNIEHAPKGASIDAQEKVTATTTASAENVPEKVESSTNEHTEQSTSNDVVSDQRNEDPQEDLLDYSDDDDEDEAAGSQVQATRSSSASATVQGDDASQALVLDENAVQNAQQSEQNIASQEAAHDESADVSNENFGEYPAGYDYYEEFSGQNYGEGFEGEYEENYYEGQELEGYSTYAVPQDHDETTNYPDDLGQHSADDGDKRTVTAETNSDKPDAVDESREASNDLLDLNYTVRTRQSLEQKHAAEDEIDFSDDEDGADSQAPVAVSAAAATVATSSSGLLSPLGQKRTIDEVGNDVVGATTSTDAKRPRV